MNHRVATFSGGVTILASLLLLLPIGVPPARAQEQLREERLRELLVAAYSLRRRGQFQAAATAYEELLRKVANKDAKRILAREAAELFVTMGRPRDAVAIYRRNHDLRREIDTLLAMDDPKGAKDALTISRYVRYPRGEVLALSKLGQHEEALARATASEDLGRERGDVLMELGRYREAATAYGQAREYLLRARALSKAGLVEEAKSAYRDAIARLRLSLRDPQGSLQRVRRIKAKYEEAPDGLTRERARLALAKAYGLLARDYRRLAEAYAGSGEPGERAKAAKLAANALKFYRKRKELLEDRVGGGDAYGAKIVADEGLDRLIEEVRAEAERYRG
ncbi:MAG: hypothetical protein D6731_16775 [Planctomycetota bacterium]|nr:MAG: hypothetical protein D6731_16775 [Planctomycetota bacterium]